MKMMYSEFIGGTSLIDLADIICKFGVIDL